MQRQITFRQYRSMDIFLFSVMLCISEVLIVLGANCWFRGADYTLSLSCAVTAIVLVRWGAWAAVPLAAGSTAFCLVSALTIPGGIQWQQWIIYLIGSQAGLIMLWFLKKWDWQQMKKSALTALSYGLLTALLIQAGRMAVSMMLGNTPGVSFGFITTDILSTLFAVLLTWIASRLDGLLEEQKHYLLRIQKEQEEAKGNG
ncbi:MAG: hypothetical protein IJO67_06165 [Clostridia bacterium]|nr:hypothetical protein [Clostridia bacterium]